MGLLLSNLSQLIKCFIVSVFPLGPKIAEVSAMFSQLLCHNGIVEK